MRALKPLLVGAIVGLLLAWSYPSSATEAEEQCYVLDLTTITEESVQETRDALLSQGWRANPTDGLEALYSPSCAVSQRIEREALTEQIRALREEVDALRRDIQQLRSFFEEVVDTFGLA